MLRSADSPGKQELRLAGFGTFAVAAALAILARGLAGDEEVAHYQIARHALEDPSLFLSLVGRPLVTLVLALPAQLGLTAARLLSAVAAAGTAVAVVRTARGFPGVSPAWAAGFLLLQPFYLAHAGTAMTEPWAALLLALILLGYAEKRTTLMAAAAAALPLVRLELVILLPWVAVELLRERRPFMAALIFLAIPLWNGIGALTSGDPLWLLHQSEWPAYPERAPGHYLASFVWTMGAGLFVPVIMGLISSLRPGDGTPRRILRAAALLFTGLVALYTFFAWWQSATSGNLRYLAIAAPAAALLAVEGVRVAIRGGVPAWIGVAVSAIGGLVYWNHPWFHDQTLLHRVDRFPVIAALLWVPVVLLGPRARIAGPLLILFLGGAGLVRNNRETLHLKPAPEQAAARRLAAMLASDLHSGRPVYLMHPMLHQALGTNPYDAGRFPPIVETTAVRAQPGSIYVWDSHYARAITPESFAARPDWVFRGGVVSADSAWVGGIFEKKPAGDGAEIAAGSLTRESWTWAARMAAAGLPWIRERAEADPGNAEAWRSLAGRLIVAGRPAEGMTAFDRADQMDPGNPENDAFRAELLMRGGRLDEARAAIERALQAKPRDGDIHALAAQVYQARGQADKLRHHIVEAARRLPRRWDIQYMAATHFYNASEPAAAEPYFLQVLKLRPGHVQSGLCAAAIAYYDRKLDLVESRLRDLIRRRPDCRDAYLSLGEVLLELGRKEDAVRAWRDGVAATGDTTLARRIEDVSAP